MIILMTLIRYPVSVWALRPAPGRDLGAQGRGQPFGVFRVGEGLSHGLFKDYYFYYIAFLIIESLITVIVLILIE